MRKKTHKDLTALEIGEEIKKELGIDIYQNTRQAAYVKARALMCHLLREKLNLRWTSIAEIFQSEGKNMNHTNVLHHYDTYIISSLMQPHYRTTSTDQHHYHHNNQNTRPLHRLLI